MDRRGREVRVNRTAPSATRSAQARKLFSLALLPLALLSLPGCSQDPLDDLPVPGPIEQPWLAPSSGGRPWNLLVLTLDTTRRDRLSCYGYGSPTTPNLDRLADEGVLFERAITPVPITLPAHATLLTGLDPSEHGVRNNGTFVLDPHHVTLAEALQAQGYATGATLGSYTVASQFGLDQGFDRYDDSFPSTSRTRERETLQRTADQVTDNVIAQLRDHVTRRPDQPFFHWAHYFDPHFPYAPPADYKDRFGDYAGEIAFMDAEIGRLMAELDRLGLRANTWILCVADHGEAFGEHQESTHGMLLYSATIRVPCILTPPAEWRDLPNKDARGRRVAETIGLKDLAPTLINAVGLPAVTLPATGSSLLPLLAGQWDGPRVVYTETLMPYLDYGWSELRGARTDRWCYIRAPEKELYDLRKDPDEAVNLALRFPEVTERLEGWCARFATDAGASPVAAPDPETLAKLRSLGYIGGGGTPGPVVNDRDPKKLMPLFAKINDASAAIGLDQLDEGRRLLEEVRAEDPDSPEACRLLGALLLRTGEPQAAADLYTQMLNLRPQDTELQLNLARAYLQSRQPQRAGELLLMVLDQRPDDLAALHLYPQALAQQNRLEDARRFLRERAARGGAPAAQALAAHASLEWGHQNFDQAYRLACQALASDSTLTSAEGLVGEYLWRQAHDDQVAGRTAQAEQKQIEARRHLERALTLDPIESLAAFRMGWIQRQAGDRVQAEEFYRRALAGNTAMGEARINLANLLMETRRLPEAISNYEIARSQGFENPTMLVNYGVALIQSGQNDQAAAMWERALELHPDPQTAEGIRRNLQRLRGQ